MDILSLDQQITLACNGSNSLFWDNLMMTVTNTFSWSLLIITLIYIIFHNNKLRDALIVILTIGTMIFVADRLCSGLVKPWISRLRPAQNPEIMYIVDTVNNYRGGSFSFFSGHACNTACVATFLAWLFRSKRMTTALIFWSATTTYTRIYLGVHYIGDIAVGWLIGIVLGTFFYYLQYKLKTQSESPRLISQQFTPTGYLRSDINSFLTIIFFNYIMVIIVSLVKSF